MKTTGILILLLVLTSCREDIHQSTEPIELFDLTWNVLDQKYSLFEEKQVNWDSVYTLYRPLISNDMDENDLFYILGDMLSLLKDGHTSLRNHTQTLRYTQWYDSYLSNYDESCVRTYLGIDRQNAGDLAYTLLEDSIAYLSCPNFAHIIPTAELDRMIQWIHSAKGVIIDVRNNTGGAITQAEKLAQRFTETDLPYGYIAHKTGPGKQDFSKKQALVLHASQHMRYSGPVVVITNRMTYSAANLFAYIVHQMPHATLLGDHTGGGGGLPFELDLPNGWILSYTTSPMFDVHHQPMELGLAPDIPVEMIPNDAEHKIDNLIEEARIFLHAY
ncbi:MAG: S41 family peptidase [Bacteroidales bacterium]|nr:S41 family peptidase [Bacteroidales bacterium]MDD3167196.1 S41 family peptidase [Bacteroidales bacterium]MDD4771189.1 S41 family peptidase [Bacteroidales bacterium]